MNKIVKILAALIGVLVLVVIIGLSYLKLALPDVGEAEEFTIAHTPEMIQRGEYLANNVMVCMDCHSERDWTRFSGPLVPGTFGKGGEEFNQNLGFPGRYFAKNITPASLGAWTDGEIFRAITTGVSRDGSALFPVMPYLHYGTLDRKDIESVIAYLRTIPAIKSENKKSESDFPMNFIINTLPQKAEFTTKPSIENIVKYGEYVVNAAACFDCHTKQEKGEFTGAPFAGGMEFPLPDGSIVRSSNITPHQTNGIGFWTEDQFVQRFKMYADTVYTPQKVGNGEFQSIMPWTMYAGMTEKDLKAAFAYLKSIKPVNNQVIRFSGSEE